MKLPSQKIVGAAGLIAAAGFSVFLTATARKVKANRVEWSSSGFYGFPIYAKAVSSDGRKVPVTLTSSAQEPLPGAKDQWLHAAKEVVRELDPR